MSEKKRRNKGPEHIREILKSARREWFDNYIESVKHKQEFKELHESCPGFYRIMFLYIEGDPIYIRTVCLN